VLLLNIHGILLRFAGALAKTVSAGMCVASAAGFYHVAKLFIMYQVYEQKKRLPQTSIEELKGIKNKN